MYASVRFDFYFFRSLVVGNADHRRRKASRYETLREGSSHDVVNCINRVGSERVRRPHVWGRTTGGVGVRGRSCNYSE